MNIIDDRKYFDYELAYKGYLKAKELFDKGGIEKVINNQDFEISGGGIDYIGTIEQWACNGYIPINANAYNITLYAIDRNFDTNKKENDWYISGEIDIYSYGYLHDNLYINNIEDIKDRINNLGKYAIEFNYTTNDYETELLGLKKVLNELKRR